MSEYHGMLESAIPYISNIVALDVGNHVFYDGLDHRIIYLGYHLSRYRTTSPAIVDEQQRIYVALAPFYFRQIRLLHV